MIHCHAAEPRKSHKPGGLVRDWFELQETIEGGFSRLTVHQVLLPTWAREQGLISPFEFRLYFAAVEMATRRQCREPGTPCRFDRFEEWEGLLGGGGEIRRARAGLKKLARLGLLRATKSNIRLVQSPDEITADLESYFELVRQVGKAASRRQPIPVPRHVVKLLAAGLGRGVACTMMGVMLRCLRRRKIEGRWTCVSGGLISAAWIARTFSVGEATVRHAFKHLDSVLGWIRREETPHWVQQRHGARTIINLAWGRPLEEPQAVLNSTPRPADFGTKSTPPIPETKNSLREQKTKNPAQPAPSGFLPSKVKFKKPTLTDVKLHDLRDTRRLLVLFEQAVGRGVITHTDFNRLRFVTAAEHALVKGSRNPPGLFMHLVRNRLWHYCTNGDEDAANARLKRHDHGDVWHREPEPEFSATPPAPRVELSDDAKLVLAVKHVCEVRRIPGDPLHVLKRERPEWTRERWDRAIAEVSDAHRTRAGLNRAEGDSVSSMKIAC